MTLLYPQNMTAGLIYQEQIIVFTKFAPPEARPCHGVRTCYDTNSAIRFMGRIAARVIL